MNLKERIDSLLSEYSRVALPRDLTERLAELFREWALEMVGEDENFHGQWVIEARDRLAVAQRVHGPHADRGELDDAISARTEEHGFNRAKQEIRERIARTIK
ncbi:MAG: hypothetical protein HY329_02340 [Chloroflexi bacterium]|nr:hypothetical protein [Chloroflexota bacterium]